jgi:hypothetical protein
MTITILDPLTGKKVTITVPDPCGDSEPGAKALTTVAKADSYRLNSKHRDGIHG